MCLVVYLSDVPQGVQQGLSVSPHQLHVSLIIATLLLKEEEQNKAQTVGGLRLMT